MRWLILLLVFEVVYSYSAAVADPEIGEADSFRLEIDPHDYLPLAVGNRWTYEHFYRNESYGGGVWHGPIPIEDWKLFEIPGYPHGEGNALPPDFLLRANRTLTIEITHTERIDGREYFVFSDAEYDWPPLPDFFWVGKKVRLSEEGFLVFRWKEGGYEVPIYDFVGLNNLQREQEKYYYTVTRLVSPVDIGRYLFFYEVPATSKQHHGVSFQFYLDNFERSCFFASGYGIGDCAARYYGLYDLVFENFLKGLSANIYGEEIWYDQLDPYGRPPDPDPPALGHLAQHNVFSLFAVLPTQIDTIRVYQGFDFSAGSAGSESDHYDGDGVESGTDDLGMHQLTAHDGSPTTLPNFRTPRGGDIVDLTGIDPFNVIFRPARKNGIGLTRVIEGHTYAVWPIDKGLALMYVIEVGLVRGSFPKAGGALADVVIEWVYNPEWTFKSPTAIKATSWGRLKSKVLREP